jgi:hypothetical protein
MNKKDIGKAKRMSCRKALNQIGGAVAFVAVGRISVKRYAIAAGHSCSCSLRVHYMRLGNCYFTAVNAGGKQFAVGRHETEPGVYLFT